jgi:hypothetical protein
VDQRLLGLVVDERPGDDQVARHPLGVARVEPTQRRAYGLVQLPGVGPVGDLRTRGRRRRALAAAGRPLTTLRAFTTVVAGTAVPPVAPLSAGPALAGLPLTMRPTRALRTSLAPVRGDIGTSATRTVAPPRLLTLRPLPCGPAVLPAAARRALPLGSPVIPAGAVVPTPVSRRAAVPPVRSAYRRTVSLGSPVIPARAVVPTPISRRTAVPPVRSPRHRTVSLRPPVLPLPARCSGVRAGVALGAAVPPVLPRATVAPAARFPLGTPLRPVSLGTTLLPAASAAVLRPTTGWAASLPGALRAAPGGRPRGSRTSSLRTALPGAAAPSSGSLSAGTAGASSR